MWGYYEPYPELMCGVHVYVTTTPVTSGRNVGRSEPDNEREKKMAKRLSIRHRLRRRCSRKTKIEHIIHYFRTANESQ